MFNTVFITETVSLVRQITWDTLNVSPHMNPAAQKVVKT